MQFDAGDVVLLSFPFTAGVGAKQRPALVLLDTGDDDLLVARVTTQPHNSSFDLAIVDWRAAGLLAPSIVRLQKLATVEKSLVRKRLGQFSQPDWGAVRSLFQRILERT